MLFRSSLLGERNEGFKLIMANFQWERLTMALGAVGGMQRLFEATLDYAKERQAFIEGRIAELESKLANAQIINPALLDADGRCVFGATVDLEDMESGEVVTYQIVGDDEADIKQGKISISSPISRALIGKYSGDVAEVQAPGGVREYEILDVKYV